MVSKLKAEGKLTFEKMFGFKLKNKVTEDDGAIKQQNDSEPICYLDLYDFS